MSLYDVIDADGHYADDIQAAIHSVMHGYASSVGFESQMAIMGVAIGAILFQLPDEEREYFTRIFIENVTGADSMSKLMAIH